MAPLSPLTVSNSPTHSSRCAPESDTATVSYSLNAAITRSSMALHPDLLDKHLLLLSRLAILNPLLAFPTYVRYTLLHLRGKPPVPYPSPPIAAHRQRIIAVAPFLHPLWGAD